MACEGHAFLFVMNHCIILCIRVKGGVCLMDDQKIINLFWQRSEKAIIETSNKYGRYCYFIAHNILRNNEDAEECVNDTWLRAWNAIPPTRPTVLKIFFAKVGLVGLNSIKQFTYNLCYTVKVTRTIFAFHNGF